MLIGILQNTNPCQTFNTTNKFSKKLYLRLLNLSTWKVRYSGEPGAVAAAIGVVILLVTAAVVMYSATVR